MISGGVYLVTSPFHQTHPRGKQRVCVPRWCLHELLTQQHTTRWRKHHFLSFPEEILIELRSGQNLLGQLKVTCCILRVPTTPFLDQS